MKKLIAIVLVVALLATGSGVALAGQGNDLPSGPHYNLNLIGMEKGKNPNFGGGNGHRIFVKLDKNARVKTTINLTMGPFDVIDADGTDGTAEFQLPNPDPTNSGTTLYSVYLRLRGKPNGDIIMYTCADDPNFQDQYCSVFQVVESRETGNGKNKFNNVSRELLYVYAWVCTTKVAGVCTVWEFMRIPLFWDGWENFLWEYDNNGVRIAQLRFYEGVSTTVPEVLKTISPDEGVRGWSGAVTITAKSGVVFTGVVDSVSFGAGIDVNSYTVDSATQITANIDITSNADPGMRIVTVTLDDGTEYVIPFTVTP